MFKNAFGSIIFILTFVAVSSVFASNYHYHDRKYRDILVQNHILASNWVALDEQNIPEVLKNYSSIMFNVSQQADNQLVKRLVPLFVMDFKNDDKFYFYWRKTNNLAEKIVGSWTIDNGMLILTLDETYASHYLKGTQFRYQITRTLYNDTRLVLKGIKYPQVTGIMSTSNKPIDDFKKIVMSKEEAFVSKTVVTDSSTSLQ